MRRVVGYGFGLAKVQKRRRRRVCGQLRRIVHIVHRPLWMGGILSLIWYVLVGLRLYRLGHFEGKVLIQG